MAPQNSRRNFNPAQNPYEATVKASRGPNYGGRTIKEDSSQPAAIRPPKFARSKRSAAVSGPGVKRTGAVMLLRKNKPKASKIGGAKGDWRKVDGGWKRRRFTASQRKMFKARSGPNSTANNGPR